MRKLGFTIFQNKGDIVGKKKTWEWERWRGVFSRHEVRGDTADVTAPKEKLDRDKDGPAVMLGILRGGASRKKANVVKAEAIALDLEGISDEQGAAAFAAIDRFEFFAWTTHKHGWKGTDLEHPEAFSSRYRVVLPFAREVSPVEYPEVWERLNLLVNNVNDKSTKDISRIHFLPSTFDPALAGTWYHPGKWLDPEVDLPALSSTPSTKGSEFELAKVGRSFTHYPVKDYLREPMRALLAGEAFAVPGERHDTMLALTYALAQRFRHLQRHEVAALFEKSIAAMREIQSDVDDLDAVWTAFLGAVEDIDKHKKRVALDEQRRRARAEPYTPEDLERIAAKQGWDPSELETRWAVQRDGFVWFLNAQGEYEGPFTRDDKLMACKKFLSRTNARIMDVTERGFRYRAPAEIISEIGTLAHKPVLDMRLQYTKFDPVSGNLYEAICPLRKLKPRFDPQIDEWLKKMCGAHYEKMVDWIATCPNLSKALCAVYLKGDKGSGKTLLPHGLARLWREGGPTTLQVLLKSGFNEELAQCPIIFADEKMPKVRWDDDVTADLREMISTHSRTVNRKNKPVTSIYGAIRLFLAANNSNLLQTSGVLTPADRDAIAERFLYIDIPQTAAMFLNAQPSATLEYWLDGGIAAHALWLAETHVVKNPGRRFVVEGSLTDMHRLLITAPFWNNHICEFFVRYLLDPTKINSLDHGKNLRVHRGRLLARSRGIAERWGAVFEHTRIEVETSKINQALIAISKKDRVQARYGQKRLWYQEVEIEQLLAWAADVQWADADEILRGLTYDTPVPKGSKADNVTEFRRPSRVRDDGGLDYGDKEEGR